MSNQVLVPEISPARLSAHHLTKNRIAIIKSHSSGLQVTNVKDHKGLKEVVKTRKFIKDIRLRVDKRRRELNADILREMRENNFAARFIINELMPVEKHLFSIEKDIAAQKAQIKKEKELKKEQELLERLQLRIEALAPYNIVPDVKELKPMSDQEFSTYLSEVRTAWETQQQLQQQAAQSLSAENEKLKQENEKLKAAIPVPENTNEFANCPHENIDGWGCCVRCGEIVSATTNTNQTVEPAAEYNTLSAEEKATIHHQLKDYVTAIRNVKVPKISNDNARLIFIKGHSLINEGCQTILDAIK